MRLKISTLYELDRADVVVASSHEGISDDDTIDLHSDQFTIRMDVTRANEIIDDLTAAVQRIEDYNFKEDQFWADDVLRSQRGAVGTAKALEEHNERLTEEMSCETAN